MAISVAVAVGDQVGDALVERSAEQASARCKSAPATEPGAEMGPLVTGEHRNRVRGYIDIGIEEGATLVVDGRQSPVHVRGVLRRRDAVRPRQP